MENVPVREEEFNASLFMKLTVMQVTRLPNINTIVGIGLCDHLLKVIVVKHVLQLRARTERNRHAAPPLAGGSVHDA